MGDGCSGLLGLMGMGKGGRSKDNFFANTGVVPTGEAKDIKAGAEAMSVRGERRPGGSDTYVEIKAPVAPGQRSSTPYVKVLPKYEKQAEEAIRRQQIPKSHQKRVKDYFDSLRGGGR